MVRRFGWHASSLQILDGGYRFWFDRDAVVAYVDTGRAFVVAGAPICAERAITETVARFVAAAGRRGRPTVFFGVDASLARRASLATLPIGEVPYWNPQEWLRTIAAAPNVRAQLRRALAKGVSAEQVDPEASAVRAVLSKLRGRWLGTHGLAPMAFLVRPAALSSDHAVWVARAGGYPVGYLCAAPIFARAGVLLQELVRDPSAPNGTAESLVDVALRAAAARGLRYATLGLAPLAGALPFWLRFLRAVGTPLFDFEGLRAFKAKLRPEGWEPVVLGCAGVGRERATLEVLSAFAGRSLAGFGIASLTHRLRNRGESSAPLDDPFERAASRARVPSFPLNPIPRTVPWTT